MAIVNSVSRLAQELGMETTAEGVENQQQLVQLRKSRFTEVQGYLLGRPAPNGTIESRDSELEPYLLAAD
jgi:EAL domain-containing protein (putative c-di-GMP-specific phosphodiesterase class I)